MGRLASPMELLLQVAFLLLFGQQVNALYFLIDGTNEKCFYEDLPKDTIVVGDFTAEAWSQQTRSYYEQPDLGIFIHVDEIFDNNHRVVSQRGGAKGRFTFTAADAGEHRICFQPTGPPAAAVGAGNILVGGAAQGGIKFGIDLVIGETSHLESADKGKFDNMVQKVKDLNARLKDIKREQAFQRDREAEFRDQSELTNSRVVKWTLLQLVVLGVTCAWQLSHLRSFFIKQKLT